MLRTENGCRYIIRWLAKLSLHDLPWLNDLLLRSTSNVVTASAVLKITLNATAVLLGTHVTNQFTASLWYLSANSGYIIVSEPNFRCPVNANHMSPGRFILRYRFYNSFDLGAHRAFDICALHVFIFYKLDASDTIPGLITVRQPVLYLTAVARLMRRGLAQFANQNLIIVVVLFFKTNITNDILFMRIFDSDQGIRIIWVNF